MVIILSGVGRVLTRRLDISPSGVAVGDLLRRSLSTSDLSTVSVIVDVRSRFRIRIPSRIVTSVGSINSVIGFVRGGRWSCFTTLSVYWLYRGTSYMAVVTVLVCGLWMLG